jgi:tripartite motif-containing protein 71
MFHVATDDLGNVVISDTNNHRIHKYTCDGVYLQTWGGLCIVSGDPPEPCYGRFHYPEALQADEFGNVYVADRENQRVQKLSNYGQ